VNRLVTRLRHRDVLGAAGAALLGLIVGATSLRFWQWRPGVPISLDGDSPLVLTQIRDILVNGWFWSNDTIGFPLGQNASFFPELNVVHVLGVKVLGLFSSNPTTVGALYFLLGYPLAAVTAYLLARSQRLALPAAVVVGVLFAAAPGHAERFEHLWLASYWTLPPALWVVIQVARGRTPWDEGTGTADRRRLRAALMLLALTLVGLSGAYYAGFTLILLVAASLLRAGAGREPRWWRAGMVTVLWTAAVTAIPLLIARIGMAGDPLTGPRPATRTALESERYAGRLIDLVLPWEGHRLETLGALTTAYRNAGRPVTETLALGIVGLVGCVALVIIGLRVLTTGRPAPERLRIWGALLLVSGAFYTVGGMGSVVALLATPQLRTWSRFSLVILLLGLLAVGHWLSRPRAAWVGAGLAATVLIVGFLDQTNPDRAPDYTAQEQRFSTTGNYTRELSQATGPDCGVLQLPVMSFPEGYVPLGYDANSQLVQHLTSSALKWSHGGMRGTQAGDWALGIDLADPERLTRELRAAGFCAVELDTRGVPSTLEGIDTLTSTLGDPVARSGDGRLVAWSLDGAAQGGAADRTRLLEPVLVGLAAGPITVDEDGVSQETGSRAGLVTSNLGSSDVGPIDVSVDVTAIGAGSRDLTVTADGEVIGRVTAVQDVPTRLDLRVNAPVGHQRLGIEVSGDPVRNAADRSVSVRFDNLTVRYTGAAHVVSLHDQASTQLVLP
jgi:hypothetical protein